MPGFAQVTKALVVAFCAALFLGAGAAFVRAEGQDQLVKADFLPGWQVEEGRYMAALKLDLAPGWKTYWRSPGDAGIPPQFDWGQSDNLKGVVLHWPSPAVFETNGMTTIGYSSQLILPVELIATDPKSPVFLKTTVDLGICKDICVPAEIALSGIMAGPKAGGQGAKDARITQALQKRPRQAAEAGVGKVSCRLEPIADGLRLTASITMASKGDEVIAFENRDPSIWIDEAKVTRQGNQLMAVTEMVAPSGQPFVLDRSAMTITVIPSEGRATEIKGCQAG